MVATRQTIEQIARSNFIIAADSLGDYATVSEAIDSFALNAAHTAKEQGRTSDDQFEASSLVYKFAQDAGLI